MGNTKKGLDMTASEDSGEEDVSSSSDVSMSDSDSDSDSGSDVSESEVDTTSQCEHGEEEEDELIKAIKKEHTKKRDHPPMIKCEDHIVKISFHPNEDLIAAALITGDVLVYRYGNEENKLESTLELHAKACRDISFSGDGKYLLSTSKDKCVVISDVESEQMVRVYEKAHENPINCVRVIDENLFATGDDEGVIKLWDQREKNLKHIFKLKRNEDTITDIVTHDAKKYMLCSSADGTLTTIDLAERQFFVQSEEYEEDLTGLGLFKHETKLLASTSKGKLLLFNWNEFGLHSDMFPTTDTNINALVPITENIVVTACDDGILRATHLFPHRHLGIVGQHDLVIESVDICNNGKFIASSGHFNDIKFWNIQYFEDFEKVDKKNPKRKESEMNLPSSKRQNVADFFSDLS